MRSRSLLFVQNPDCICRHDAENEGREVKVLSCCFGCVFAQNNDKPGIIDRAPFDDSALNDENWSEEEKDAAQRLSSKYRDEEGEFDDDEPDIDGDGGLQNDEAEQSLDDDEMEAAKRLQRKHRMEDDQFGREDGEIEGEEDGVTSLCTPDDFECLALKREKEEERTQKNDDDDKNWFDETLSFVGLGSSVEGEETLRKDQMLAFERMKKIKPLDESAFQGGDSEDEHGVGTQQESGVKSVGGQPGQSERSEVECDDNDFECLVRKQAAAKRNGTKTMEESNWYKDSVNYFSSLFGYEGNEANPGMLFRT